MKSKEFRHKSTDKTAIAHFMSFDGNEEIVCYMKGNRIDYDILLGNDWEEIVEYPTGTKVKDMWTEESVRKVYKKIGENDWKLFNDSIKFLIKENEIGKGKRFELIKEENKPEWTILSYINSIGNVSYLTDWHDSSKDTIHSVRRESDGEVFTVGDFFNDCDLKNEKIIDFTISSVNGLLVNSNLLKNIQKVKPKEWEITAFRTTKDGVFIEEFGINGFSKFKNDRNAWIKDRLSVHWEIYSVKRLSDGMEFKIGDKIGKYLTIIGFKIVHDNIEVKILDHEPYSCEGYKYAGIMAISKKEKIFTTEDEVDIFDNTNTDVFAVFKDDFKLSTQTRYLSINKLFWYFSTKEKAEEYILNNKRMFSIDDIIDNWGIKEGEKSHSVVYGRTIKNLIKLGKTRT